MGLLGTHIVNDWAPIGYAALVQSFDLQVIPPLLRSYLASKGQRRTIIDADERIEVYPKNYRTEGGVGDHLEFALKYEGVNLEVLAALFEKADPTELEAYIKTKPTGKHARRMWFLYEFLTGKKLALDDLKTFGRYDNLLDENKFFSSAPRPSFRHKINDNLLGNRLFCPMIRRTEKISKFIEARFDQQCKAVMGQYPEQILRRALDYLYTRETRSSYEIERIEPNQTRIARFVGLLKRAGTEKFLNKEALIALQQATVEERYANHDWRDTQNYVGMPVSYDEQQIFYISPKPEDVPSLMDGLFESAARMLDSNIHPVVIAGAIAFGFVYVHPFEDGNGRLHRFLIHHLLAKTGFTPDGGIFPVSAIMLRQRARYEELLDTVSKPLLPLIEYEMYDDQKMRVLNETAAHYRYMDMTRIVEGLFEFIQEIVRTELPIELQFLVNYDRAKRSIQDVVDMPDRRIDLFINFCRQNRGRLSKAKRSTFAELTDDEVARMEECVLKAFGELGPGHEDDSGE